MDKKLFCALKGYGDFVVSCRFLRDMPRDRYRLLCARHLEPLCRALGDPVNAEWADLTGNGRIPAVYDVRLQGAAEAMRSILRIRGEIRNRLHADEVLLFEYLTARERMMAWPKSCEQIGRTTPNIYSSYARHFGGTPKQGTVRFGKTTRLAIFPDARLPHRVLPADLLQSIARECAARQLPVKAVRVGNGSESPAAAGIPVEWIDGFDALVNAIRSADVVVSSDSLPGHIAEYFGVPVFVFAPRRKDYWMPGSAFANDGFALFDNPGALGPWLERVHTLKE